MESLSPRVMDNVTQYLRELKPEEMAGSANFHRVHKMSCYASAPQLLRSSSPMR